MVGFVLVIAVLCAIPIIIYQILNPPYDPYKIDTPGLGQRYKNASESFNDYLFRANLEHEKKEIERRMAKEDKKNREDLLS